MIYLGKLLQNDDLRALVAERGIITVNSVGGLNDPLQLLNENLDLNDFLNTTVAGLVPLDPCFISYTIVDCTHGREEIIRETMNSRPMRSAKGLYFAPLKIDPKLFTVGRHLILWHVKRHVDSQLEMFVQEFDVTRQASYSGEFSRSTYSTKDQFKGYNQPRRIFQIRRT